MIDRIVVPLDRSALSEIAIPFATTLAGMVGARIEYLTVVPEQEDLDTGGADRYLLKIAERHPPSTDFRIVVRMGSAADVIVDEADHPGAMIVMATHGRGGLQRMLVGSIADIVVRTATVPVALIRDGVGMGTVLEPFSHILVPLDGSDRSATSLPLAIELARRSGAHLHLLQVVPPVQVNEIGYASDASLLSPDVYADMMD
ncbi:MAG TPA: universal stress protein, partial [Thermomicrobiales bacterium]|nr:universal stress protein [Thermomicrobiales bacterium]